MDINIFEYAVANKLRFNYKGLISVEDLYDLSTIQLDSIYKSLKREQKKEDEDSLLSTVSTEDKIISIKIEIVKAIVAKKLAQEQALKTAAEKRKKKQRLLAILDRKQNEALESKSMDEIQAMINELD